MKPRYFPILGSLFAFTAAGVLLLPTAAPAQSTEVEANADVEVLTRGPVHEAFAESVSFEPVAGMTVSTAPPALIEELPPEQQPEGDNVTWISGYWAWDDDQNDFLWISGVWRNIPPGRQWVPGYWDDLGGGSFQWVSGYWADSTTEEVEYVPTAPPKSIDAGPNIAAPSDDHTWVPGNWRWNQSRYAWSPGYWLPLRPNWTWVPSRHCWTPRGYIYVDGYWDYAVVNRGVLFAPIHFRRHVWSSPGYYYTPSIVVSLSVFADHLFIRPRHCHYYFGDYYAPRYRDFGFYPSFHWHRRHHGYDPIYAYNRWHHRHDSGWDRRYEDNYNFFRDNDRFRPPHTWAAMRGLRNERFDDDRNRSRLFANSFDSFVQNPERGQRFRALDKDRRQQFVAQRQEMRDFSRQRRDLESRAVARGGAEDGGQKMAFREKLRRSPVVGRQAEQFAKSEAPPKRPEARGNRLSLKRAENADRQVQARRDAVRDRTDRQAAGREKRGALQNDTARPGRDLTSKQTTREMPGKRSDSAVERKATPKAQTRDLPQRKQQVTPERKAQPKPQVRQTPQRKQQVAPERKAQPKPQARQAPQRKQQAAPQRQQQPRQQARPVPQQRKQQVSPERKREPKVQAQRKAPAAERIAQPKQQARQAPQRKAQQPRQQQQARPQQRQVQPRQQQQARPQQRQVQPRQQQQARPQQRQAQPRQQQARPQPQQRQNRQTPQQERKKKERADA